MADTPGVAELYAEALKAAQEARGRCQALSDALAALGRRYEGRTSTILAHQACHHAKSAAVELTDAAALHEQSGR